MPRKYPSTYDILFSDRGNTHLIWGVGAMCAAFAFNCLGDMGTQARVKSLESTVERLEAQVRQLRGKM